MPQPARSIRSNRFYCSRPHGPVDNNGSSVARFITQRLRRMPPLTGPAPTYAVAVSVRVRISNATPASRDARVSPRRTCGGMVLIPVYPSPRGGVHPIHSDRRRIIETQRNFQSGKSRWGTMDSGQALGEVCWSCTHRSKPARCAIRSEPLRDPYQFFGTLTRAFASETCMRFDLGVGRSLSANSRQKPLARAPFFTRRGFRQFCDHP